jgi:universal stress protein A
MKLKTSSKNQSLADVPEDAVQHEEHENGTTLPAPAIKKILVPVDFSNCSLRALDYAVALAEHFASRMILLHVVEPGGYGISYCTLPADEGGSEGNPLQPEREQLSALHRKRVPQRVSCELLVRMGHAYSEIPDTAKALGADIIVLGAQGSSGLKHVSLGSTAERVLKHSPCPVLTVPF